MWGGRGRSQGEFLLLAAAKAAGMLTEQRGTRSSMFFDNSLTG